MSWTDVTPPTTVWTNPTGSSTSWSSPTGDTQTFTDIGGSFLVTTGLDFLTTVAGLFLVTQHPCNSYSTIASPSNSWAGAEI